MNDRKNPPTKAKVFLVFNKNGFVKATKSAASVGREEVGVMASFEFPADTFRSPYIHATIEVPEHAVVVPEIKATVE